MEIRSPAESERALSDWLEESHSQSTHTTATAVSDRCNAHSDKEPMIIILGPTGAGKSSFINVLTGADDVLVGQNLASETRNVRVVRWVQEDGRVLNLIDTPGFDNSRDGMTDAKVLEMIAEFLVEEYKSDEKHLTGLIYIHPISDARVTGSARRHLRIPQGLCGPKALKNVVIVTSKWDTTHPTLGAKRERELKSKETFFKPLIDAGAVMIPHDNGHTSAMRIISHFDDALPVQTDIVRELVEDGKTLAQTSAADALQQEIEALWKRNENDRIAAEKGMQGVIKTKDAELLYDLEEEPKAEKQDNPKVEMKHDALHSQMEALSKMIEEMRALLKARDEEARREREGENAENQRILEEATKRSRVSNGLRVDKVAGLSDTLGWRFAFVGVRGYYSRFEDNSLSVACPSDLTNILRTVNPVDILSISIGPDDEYFLRTRSKIYSFGLPPELPLAEVAQFTFGPSSAWFALLVDGGYRWSNIPPSLSNKINSLGSTNITSLALGPDGSWAMTYGNGNWSTCNVDPRLNEKLNCVNEVNWIVLNDQDKYSWALDAHLMDVHWSFRQAAWDESMRGLFSRWDRTPS